MNFLRPISPIIKKIVQIYTSKEREFVFKNISVTVLPGVFHPGMFFSTKILLEFIEQLDLADKTFLELGAGTGTLSILASKKGAKVYASDISTKAVKNIRLNAERNNEKINVISSNLFDDIPGIKFDFILINPPYYKKDPANEDEYAWYCGHDFQYFHMLFKSLSEFVGANSKVFMILSEVSDIEAIIKIGRKNNFDWQLRLEKFSLGEKNNVYEIIKS